MGHFRYVVLSNPVEGREDEYNRWYTEQHLPDVLRVPGFVAAQRFRVAGDASGLAHRYLAIYEIESEDIDRTLADLASRAGTPAMPISEALDTSTISATAYAAICDRIVAESR